MANEQLRETRLVIITGGRFAIRLNPFRMLRAECIAGPPTAAACSIIARRHDGTGRMNKLGDPASSRELAALWARLARIMHLALKLGVTRNFSDED
jgi:hypothetical protein